VVQVQARRWRTLSATASFCFAGLLRTFRRERRKADLEWELYFPLFATSLPDGLRDRHLIVRRRVNGKWEYRSPTLPEEEAEYVACDAW
jgi:hypothetical protein